MATDYPRYHGTAWRGTRILIMAFGKQELPQHRACSLASLFGGGLVS